MGCLGRGCRRYHIAVVVAAVAAVVVAVAAAVAGVFGAACPAGKEMEGERITHCKIYTLTKIAS